MVDIAKDVPPINKREEGRALDAPNEEITRFVTAARAFCTELRSNSDAVKLVISIQEALIELYASALNLPTIDVTNQECDTDQYKISHDETQNVFHELEGILGSVSTYWIYSTPLKEPTPETKVSVAILSDNLSEIYQIVGHVVRASDSGRQDCVLNIIDELASFFGIYWGVRVIEVLVALHALRYGGLQENKMDDAESND